jgi:hypothetical protein
MHFGWQTLSLPDTDPAIFELALSFLYRGNYKDYSSSTNPMPKSGQSKALELKIHTLLYCFASLYKLDGLVALTIENIIGSGDVPYVDILGAAKEAYQQLPEDDVWYREYFKDETRNEMSDNVDLVQEPWIVEVFREGRGRLAVDLFTTLTDRARGGHVDQDSEHGIVLTPTTSPLDDTPCELRKKHLTSLKSEGPWKYCPKCHHERDQMMTTGRAIVSVVFTDLWPTFSQDIINASPEIAGPIPRKSKGRNKLRRALKEAICHLPVDRVSRAILAEDGDGQCPDQADHLQQQDGKWLWESCSRCLHDRELMLKKLRELGIGEGFAALCGLISMDETISAQAAMPSTDDQDRHMATTDTASLGGSVTADTLGSEAVLVEEYPNSDECPAVEEAALDEPGPVDCEAEAVVCDPESLVYEPEWEEPAADIPEQPCEESKLDDVWGSFRWSLTSKKDKKKRKAHLQEEPAADPPPPEPAEPPIEERPAEDRAYPDEAAFLEFGAVPTTPFICFDEAPVEALEPELEADDWPSVTKKSKKKKSARFSVVSPPLEPSNADPPPPESFRDLSEPPEPVQDDFPSTAEPPTECSPEEAEIPLEEACPEPPPPPAPEADEWNFGFAPGKKSKKDKKRRKSEFAFGSGWDFGGLYPAEPEPAADPPAEEAAPDPPAEEAAPDPPAEEAAPDPPAEEAAPDPPPEETAPDPPPEEAAPDPPPEEAPEDPPTAEEVATEEVSAPEADNICSFRRRHLVEESRWMRCAYCRLEMAQHAKNLVGGY